MSPWDFGWTDVRDDGVGDGAKRGGYGLCRRAPLLLSTACCVALLIIPLFACAYVSDGTFGVKEAALRPLDGRLRIALTGRHLEFNDLEEPFAFNPAAAYVPQTGGWERFWDEDELYATVSYDLLDFPRATLRPGMHVGVARGFFKARNESAAFYETWETRPAFFWGPSLYAELRVFRESGPFLALTYDYFMAEAAEAEETVGSARGRGTRPEDRDAYFRWSRQEAAVAAGWRFGAVTPQAGVRYRDLTLKKTLTHHISQAGLSGTELALVQALNSQPSEYRYAASSPWVPFVELAWRPLPNLSLEAAAILSRDQDFTISAVFSF